MSKLLALKKKKITSLENLHVASEELACSTEYDALSCINIIKEKNHIKENNLYSNIAECYIMQHNSPNIKNTETS